MAKRMAIAEQMQSGKMNFAEGEAAITEKWSQAVSESQQRANARNSVTAQQQTAAAANTAAWAAMAQATKPPPMQPSKEQTTTAYIRRMVARSFGAAQCEDHAGDFSDQAEMTPSSKSMLFKRILRSTL